MRNDTKEKVNKKIEQDILDKLSNYTKDDLIEALQFIIDDYNDYFAAITSVLLKYSKNYITSEKALDNIYFITESAYKDINPNWRENNETTY